MKEFLVCLPNVYAQYSFLSFAIMMRVTVFINAVLRNKCTFKATNAILSHLHNTHDE